jgi:hypothetical protein
MNHLFAMADYGSQYRTISKAGAILGSMSDAGVQNPSLELPGKVPRWLSEAKKKRSESDHREEEK